MDQTRSTSKLLPGSQGIEKSSFFTPSSFPAIPPPPHTHRFIFFVNHFFYSQLPSEVIVLSPKSSPLPAMSWANKQHFFTQFPTNASSSIRTTNAEKPDLSISGNTRNSQGSPTPEILQQVQDQ